MSELYNHYVDGKKPADITHGVVTDIRRGRIGGADLSLLIAELDNNGILDNSTIKISPKTEWNDDYLDLLSYEVVGGTFSKQYLFHLAEVTEYVRANSKSHSTQSGNMKTIIIGIAVLGLITLGIIVVASLLKG